MPAEPMKKEIPPAVLVVALVLLVFVIGFVFWYLGKPAGVKTKVPPKPNPPGGIPTAVE